MRKVKILGTKYEIFEEATNDEFPLLQNMDGFHDVTTKKIVVAGFANELGADQNLDFVKKQVTRHELIHAFMSESGMEEWSQNEQLVNWFAIQSPKIFKVFQKLDLL